MNDLGLRTTLYQKLLHHLLPQLSGQGTLLVKLSVNLKQSSPYARRIRGMPEPNDSTNSTSVKI